MIKPTVGRSIWIIRPGDTEDIRQPETGIITYVWDDRLINVAGFNHNGEPFSLTSLVLVQPDEPKPKGDFACWTTHQKAQAEALQQATLYGEMPG